MSKKSKKSLNKLGKHLFNLALDDLYYFEDDKIEDLLDKTLLKFRGQADWRKATKASIWGFQEIRNRICQIAAEMYAPITVWQKEKRDDYIDTNQAA